MNETKKINSFLRCSFCRRLKSEVRLLILGPVNEKTGVAISICDKCAAAAKDLASKDTEEQIHHLSEQPIKE